MPLGAIVVREPQNDAFRGLENLLVGAAGGMAKQQRRKQLLSSFPQDRQTAFSQLPTELLESMAQVQSQQTLMQTLNPGGFAAQQALPQANLNRVNSQSNVNNARAEVLRNPQPRPTRLDKPVTVRFDQQMQGGSKQKRSVLVPPDQANEIERIANTYQTVDPQEIFESQLFALEDDNAGFASAIDTASALPDYVKAAVVMNKARATDAIDSYFDLWQQERDKRGVLRDDVVPDLPAEEKIVAMKLEAVMGYLDDETAGELKTILGESNPEEMRQAWETLSGG